MPLIKRSDKGSPLSIAEMDGNLDYCSPGTYLEVNISSAQILAMGTTPIELLPAPGANSYYEYHGVIEYTGGATAYADLGTDHFVLGDSDTYSGDYIAKNLINNTIDLVMGFNSFPKGQEAGSAGSDVGYPVKLNKALVFFTYNNTDPTLGDGTMKAKIWYTVRTFG